MSAPKLASFSTMVS